MEDKMIFQKLQKGDLIFSLERDRRALYPIFDQARILKVGESKPMASMGKDGFVNSLELVIQDSVSQITIYLPSQAEEGIYNGIYYTTNLDNIISEVSNQRQNAVNILNNRERYEAIVSECDKILGSINYKEPSKPAPGFEEFKAYMGNVDVRLNRSEALLEKIAEELGLFKDK
nr:MAG: hypothetical protein [Bacteriophage sp.]